MSDKDEETKGSGLSSNGFLWLAIAVAGFMLVRTVPWEGSRPIETGLATYRLPASQDVDARLWQDPLAAVARARLAARERAGTAGGQSAGNAIIEEAPEHSIQQMAESIGQHLEGGHLLVLGVMVSGRPYTEDAESRRRARYALLAGASRIGLVPSDPDHIGYFDPRPTRLCPPAHEAQGPPAGLPAQFGYPSGHPAGRSPSRGASPVRDPEFIAYEWLEARGGLPSPGQAVTKTQHVLVLWLDEDVFSARPLQHLGALARRLERQCDRPLNDPTHSLNFVVLGPASSDTVEAIVLEVAKKPTGDQTMRNRGAHPNGGARIDADRAPADADHERGRQIRFYSYGATASDAYLLRRSGGAAVRARLTTDRDSPSGSAADGCRLATDTVSRFLACNGVTLLRVNATDNLLARALGRELSLRGIDPGNHASQQLGSALDGCSNFRKHVVLVTERDSLYGQALPQTVTSELQSNRCKALDPGQPAWLHSFSYLRGLDGQLPTSDEAPRKESAQTGTADKAGGLDSLVRDHAGMNIERPEGQGQFDYLRRLSVRLRELEDGWAQDGGRIAAVGVLGNDVYDKLLILQALRPHFPDAIFFTTDLDARLLHPRERQWTRNLVVVSGFGLQLRPELQQEILPFRDSYQTSVYLSALLALTNADADRCAEGASHATNSCPQPVSQDTIDGWLKEPRVFEVGRHGPLDLSREPTTRQRPTQCQGFAGLGQCGALHPQRPELFPQPGSQALRQILAIAAFGLLALAFARDWPRQAWRWASATHSGHARPSVRIRIMAVLASLAITIFLLVWLNAHAIWIWLGRYLTEDGHGEPVALLDGVSLWPTQLLRVVIVLLSIALIARGWLALNQHDREISLRIGAQRERDALEEDEKGDSTSWWKRILHVFSLHLDEPGDKSVGCRTGLTGGAERFWKKYLHQGQWEARLLRVLSITALYWAVGGALIQLLGRPVVPYRGTVSLVWDRWLAQSSGLWTLLLVFFTADATLFCCKFVKELQRDLPERTLGELPQDAVQRSRWSKTLLQDYADKLRLDPQYLDDWISIYVIAWRTRVVGEMIYYPFIVISLLILARSPLFDKSSMSAGLVVLYATSIAIVATCAVLLRSAAERFRRKAVWRLRKAQIALLGTDEKERPKAQSIAAQLDIVIDQIRSFNRGSFAPYSQQPLVKALLLPLGSLGGTGLLEYLILSN